ncbi:MAG: DUF87 domain-containing protein [Candidatus Thermoplasmatota archaeon]|nr:DUF87 domain-containing protein [Candidatus Thermoplasmatota archaeon]
MKRRKNILEAQSSTVIKSFQKEDYLVRKGKAITYIEIKDMPFELRDNFKLKLATENPQVGQIIQIHPVPERNTWNLLNRELEKLFLNLTGKQRIGDRETENHKIMLDNLNRLKEDVASGKETIVKYSMAYFIRGEPIKLRRTKKLSINYLRNIGVRPVVKISCDSRVRNQIIEGKLDGIYLNVASAAHIIPFNNGYLFQSGGTFYGIDELTNAPVFIERSKFPSSHELVVGMTGFGKSFFVKTTMFREKVSRKVRIKIIDPLDEYKSLGEALGSTNVDLMNLKMSMLEKVEFLTVKENVDRSLALLMSLFELKTEDRGVIDTALTIMYEKGENLQFLQDYIRKQRIETYNIISPLFEGSLRKFISGENPDLTGDIVMNLGNVPKRLLPFYMLLSLDLIMRSHDSDITNLVIDEAHYLLQDDTVGTLERYLRHARHGNVSMILISQSANDFTRSKSTVSVLENCSIHVLLKHQNITREMAEFYNIDEKLDDFLRNGAGFNGKDSLAMLKMPGYNSILRIRSNPEEMRIVNGLRKD